MWSLTLSVFGKGCDKDAPWHAFSLTSYVGGGGQVEGTDQRCAWSWFLRSIIIVGLTWIVKLYPNASIPC